MSGLQVLLIAGTHGNEINAPWLFDQWNKSPELFHNNDLEVFKVLGNPEAIKVCKRYLHRDLNRSFLTELFNDKNIKDYEVLRAKELLLNYGLRGSNSCQIAIDLHSTTSSMGSSLVVYGRRYADLAIASLLQSRLGLPIYLHEGDNIQKGFLVESWPCGLVIEIGPVAQGMLQSSIINQTRVAVEVCLEELVKIKSGIACFPKRLVIHRHIKSIDFPRTKDGHIDSLVHPQRQGSDWLPISKGAPLFAKLDGSIESFEEDESLVPVFINEAAYAEKNIAMSLAKREIWEVTNEWKDAINDLLIID